MPVFIFNRFPLLTESGFSYLNIRLADTEKEENNADGNGYSDNKCAEE